MELFSIKTPIIYPKDDLIDITLKSIEKANLKVQERDILIFAETVVGTAQGRIIKHNNSKKIDDLAKQLAQKYKMDPFFVQIILEEADTILGGVSGVLLTEKDGILIANAGVDQSNSGGLDTYVLFPENPSKTAHELRNQIKNKLGLKQLGVMIIDSRIQPLKKGTIGVAIAVAGFEPVNDCRGRKDLFGRELHITTRALADDLASAAELIMGEADEQTPIVLARNIPVEFSDREINISEMLFPRDQCLFMNVFKDLIAYKKPEYSKNH